MNTLPLLNPSYLTSVTTEPCITIFDNNRYKSIPISTLMCMEASGNYTYVHTTDGKRYFVSKTLKSYASLLEGLSFVRVHKSWLINPDYLRGFCQYDRLLYMQDGKEIAISRRRFREVSTLLTPHLS